MSELSDAFSRHEVALFLDLDGTLVDIAERPWDVRVPQELRASLAELHARNGGALALISGRRLAELDELLRPLRLPSAGVHGHERRDARGQVQPVARSTALDPARALLEKSAERDILVEDKLGTLVLHYRTSPELEARCRELAQQAAVLAGTGWRVEHGKMYYEVRPAGTGKDGAVAAFLDEIPFAGRLPAFFGDDRTDEDAFQFVNACGGWSVFVGPPGVTHARHRLDDPRAVIGYLRTLLA